MKWGRGTFEKGKYSQLFQTLIFKLHHIGQVGFTGLVNATYLAQSKMNSTLNGTCGAKLETARKTFAGLASQKQETTE